jgi:hypothetical protein
MPKAFPLSYKVNKYFIDVRIEDQKQSTVSERGKVYLKGTVA